MKTCKKCLEQKPLSEFYAQPGNRDGRGGRCKECVKARVKENYRNNIDKYKEYEKWRSQLPHRIKLREDYAKTETGRIKGNKAKRSYLERNPIKRAAHIKAGNAIRDGLLPRLPCEVCSTTHRVQAHHDDYEKPLEVRWLCKKHHDEVHWGRQS